MPSETVFRSSPFRDQKTEVLPPLFPNASALVGKHYRTETQQTVDQVLKREVDEKACLKPAGSGRKKKNHFSCWVVLLSYSSGLLRYT